MPLDAYRPCEVIGKGSFGLIRKVQRISDGRYFARKELEFHRMSDRDRKQICAEVNILRQLQHRNIVQYEERFVDHDTKVLYVIMEYCEGGDLASTIKRCRATKTRLPEAKVWSYFAQMVCGLDACHHRGSRPNSPNSDSTSCSSSSSTIAAVSSGINAAAPGPSAVLHRDLKPENVFLDGNDGIKIGDFGLSKEMAAQDFASTYVGTPYYMSPELATGSPYDIKADIWALGCVIFELCALTPPFDATTQAELTRKIKLGHVPELPHNYSAELSDLIISMLDLDPRRRPSTKELLQDRYINLYVQISELSIKQRDLDEERRQQKAKRAELEKKEQAFIVREASLEQREKQLEARERTLRLKEEKKVPLLSSDEKDVSMMDATAFITIGNSGKENSFRHLEMDRRKSLPGGPAVYDLSSEDLPSPFLRRAIRHNMMSKKTTFNVGVKSASTSIPSTCASEVSTAFASASAAPAIVSTSAPLRTITTSARRKSCAANTNIPIRQRA